MLKILRVFLLLCFCTTGLWAQVMPAENAKLHYRIIGFSFPVAKDAGAEYTLEIAKGSHSADGTFRKERIIVKETTINKVIAEVPAFGTLYTWRVVTKTAGKERPGPFHHFSTRSNIILDSGSARMLIMKDATAFADAYVFLDCTKALYDMKGNMVWFLPDELVPEGLGGVEDLRPTPQGTITYLYNSGFVEITYDGRQLRRMPGIDTVINGFKDNTHHEGTRLKNGHYMVLGLQRLFWKRVGEKFEIRQNGSDTSGGYAEEVFEVVNEFDEAGRKIWQYKMSDYVFQSDLINWVKADGTTHLNVHLNSFYLDEEKSELYLGMRDISRIIKVHYPDGKVLGEYGKKYKEGEKNLNQDLFCNQHAIRVRDNNIYVFNNNSCSRDVIPTLTILKEQNSAPYNLEKVWEYKCDVVPIKMPRNRGGNIVDLQGGSVFASLCTPFNEIIIVNRQKEVLWQARPERWFAQQNSWMQLPNYRASILPAAKDLGALIWFGH